MDLAGKLQIKPGTLVAIAAAPVGGPDLAAGLQVTSQPDEAGAVIAFAHRRADPVRQISIDGVWSALRFRPAP